ncbi:MAG: Co2+/Mg2+ efflux protein ApaG [Aeromonadaceae bacterium]
MAAKLLITPYPRYLDEESRPDQAHYSFAYTIEIENQGPLGVQLLERHWIITDANGLRTEVQGPGVVGEQPFIAPGESYAYQSGVAIKTPLGFMEGSYTFQAEDGELFEFAIPVFTLATPHLIH